MPTLHPRTLSTSATTDLLLPMPSLHLIICTDRRGRIGTANDLLYRIPLDMQRFTSLTTHTIDPDKTNVVLMGYATWASLPDKYRPLPDRLNAVLTRSPEKAYAVRQAGAYPFLKVDYVCGFLQQVAPQVERIYLMGGAQLYAHPALRSMVETVHWTEVDDDEGLPASKATVFDVGAHFDANDFDRTESWSTRAPGTYVPTNKKGEWTVHFHTLVRKLGKHAPAPVPAVAPIRTPAPIATLDAGGLPSAEAQYLALLRRVAAAPLRTTRNSKTRSVFGARIVVDLSDGRAPALTTKKFAWKTCLRELLWFVRGDTDNAKLQAENVHIWDGNASRAFLDSRGLTDRAEGDLGPVYGFQWRHSGAAYTDCHADYRGQGVDQLEEARQLLQTDPHSRRILFTAWNPSDLDRMALPPCHVLGQWYVEGNDELWLQVYQRSGDLFLGVPFNLFSYSALVHMMAHLTGLRPGGLVHVLGDAHIYETHADAVQAQLARTPTDPPTLRIHDQENTITTWEGFTLNTFVLTGYVPQAPIRAPMVA